MDTSEQSKDSIVNPLEPLEEVERVRWYEDPVYIKMCEKAEKIQEGHKPQEGDWYLAPHDTGFNLIRGLGGTFACGVSIEKLKEIDNNYIWLPRQDQLQEMLGDFKECRDLVFGAGYFDDGYGGYYKMPGMGYWDTFTSMEQLWLAFVMKEKYNKMWDGEKWQ